VEVQHVDFVSVPVRDIARATAFYRDTLELPQTGEGAWPEFKLGDNAFLYLVDPTNLGGQFTAPHSAQIALRVPDVAETRRELEERGVEFDGEILDTGVCHMAFFRDSEGNALMLHRRYAPRDA
jgi:predicted enzyme related to lactoylglutathione lyase